jgi:hypothetical protein
LDQVTEDLEQLCQQRRSDCLDTGKEETSSYYENKIFRTDCKKFCSLLRQTNANVKNAPTNEVEIFWKEIVGKNSNIMKKPSGSTTIANKIQVWNGACRAKW